MPKIYMVNIHEKFSVCMKEIHLMGGFRERGTLTFQFESVFTFKLYMQLIFKRNVSRMNCEVKL